MPGPIISTSWRQRPTATAAFLPPDFPRYRAVSPLVREILGESASCDEPLEPTSLIYSPVGRTFSRFFHDYRDIFVTADPSERNQTVASGSLDD